MGHPNCTFFFGVSAAPLNIGNFQNTSAALAVFRQYDVIILGTPYGSAGSILNLQNFVSLLKAFKPAIKIFGYTALGAAQSYHDWLGVGYQSEGIGAWANILPIGPTGLDGIYLDVFGLGTVFSHPGDTTDEIQITVLGGVGMSGTFVITTALGNSDTITYDSNPTTLAANITEELNDIAGGGLNAVTATAQVNSPAQTGDIVVTLTGSQVHAGRPYGSTAVSLTGGPAGYTPQVLADTLTRVDQNNALHYIHIVGPIGLAQGHTPCAAMIDADYDLTAFFSGSPDVPDSPALILGNDSVAFVDYFLLDEYFSSTNSSHNPELFEHRMGRLGFAAGYQTAQRQAIVQIQAGTANVYSQANWDQVWAECLAHGIGLIGINATGSTDFFITTTKNQTPNFP